MLRVPLMARGRTRTTWQAPSESGAEAVRDYLSRLAADSPFREAVEISSPTLVRIWNRLLEGDAMHPTDRQKAVRALTRYWLRAATRPTPFGLMAGVLSTEFGDRAEGELHAGGCKGVRPDRGRLAKLVARWEQDPVIACRLRVTVNNLCFVRGDRVVLPVAPDSSEGESENERTDLQGPLSRTLRYTPVVRAALQAARRPVRLDALQAQLQKEFAGASAEAVRKLLMDLLAANVLLTELPPPLDASDPLEHLLHRLPEGSSAHAQVSTMQRAIEAYCEAPPGEGRDRWQAAVAAAGGDGSLQVDFRRDGRVVLPHAVARELEMAADVLWRISPRTAHPLAPYHAAFLERYGSGRRVPLQEMLDEDIGLGAPAGYRVPRSHRASPGPEPRDPARERCLLELAMNALAHNEREVVLDEAWLERLEDTSRTERRRSPPSMDLLVHVVADSVDALDRGAFTLVVATHPGSSQAGAIVGRFAYCLPGAERLRSTLRAMPPSHPSQLPVQLHFQVAANRFANVAQVPTWLEHRLLVGTYGEFDDPNTLSVEDIGVAADADRFILFSESLGRAVDPVVLHMLNREMAASNVARFLAEASNFDLARWSPWTWGSVAHAPFLPAVRIGRTVLCPAQWYFDEAARDDEALEAWRRRWRVPDHVQMIVADQRIPLHLEVPAHREMLRQEAAKRGTVSLQEAPTQDIDGGWLRGPDGAYDAELVVSLLRRDDAAPVANIETRRAPIYVREDEYPPGGPWLYARIEASAERHPELLTRWLTPVFQELSADIDRWFFIRYADPEPHLRLRFHGRPDVLHARLLPRLHELARDLRLKGLARGLRLDTYVPETVRYGGSEAIVLAEKVFFADSRFVLTRLRAPGTDLLLDTACDVVELVRAFHQGYGASWSSWLTAVYPKDQAHHQAFVARRREALARISLDGSAKPDDARGEVQGAMQVFGRRLCELEVDADDVLGSVLHMHCNRRLGIDAKSESQVMAIARGAVQAHLDRRRAMA